MADVDSMRTLEEIDPRKTKIALWGFGNQNKLMAKYLYERNFPVVSVVSRHDIGEDYGKVDSDWGNIGVKKTGVEIIGEKDAPAHLAS